MTIKRLTLPTGAVYAGHFEGTNPGPVSPAVWHQRRDPDNPVLWFDMDAEEALHPNGTMYSPLPVKVGNDVIIYTKTDGEKRVRAWRRTNGVGTPTLIGTAIAPGALGQWDDLQVAECAGWYDEDADLIHLLYKGLQDAGGGSSVVRVGYATAPGSTPATVTKHGSNPVLEPADVEAALSLGAGTVADVMIYDFVLDGGTWHGFGFYSLVALNTHRMIYLTSPDLVTWAIVEELDILPPPIVAGGAPVGLAFAPCVFRHPSAPYWVMIYSEGLSKEDAEVDYMRVALSQDLSAGAAGWSVTDEFLLLAEFRILDAVASNKDESRAWAAHLLKGGASNSRPLLVNDEYQLWYSFSNNTINDASGVLYLQPQAARTPRRRPILEVTSRTANSIADAGASFDAGWQDVEWDTQIQQQPRNWMSWHLEPPSVAAGATATEWTCRAAGTYRLEVPACEFAANATGTRALRFLLNGVTVPDICATANLGASIRTPVRLSATLRLEEGDVLKVQAWQDSGGALDLASYFAVPRLTVVRVGEP